jgi:hypothetical protein
LALVQGITCAARSSSNTRGGLLVAIKMQIRRGTLAAWAAASNPVLEPGELGFVTDVGKTAFKIGNTAGTGWDTLPYVNSTYPELLPDAGGNLNLSTAQGRYPLLSGTAYTNAPGDFTNTTTDGSSILLVTVPTNSIIIQELTTSLTPCKRWIRAYNSTPAVWTAWKRLDTLSASESLSITNLTLSGRLFVPPGSATAPSITITGDTTTGLYQSAAQEIGIATNGVNRLKIGDSALISTTTFNAVGVNAAASGITSSGGITVSGGTTALKATNVDGALSVVSTTPANQLSVGSITSALTQTVIKQNAYPAVGIFGRNPADASGLLFGTYNAAGTAVTTIRSDGNPTAGTDLTTKTYVDTQVAGASFMPVPKTATGVGQIVTLSDIYAGGGGAASVTVGAAGQTWAYVGFFYPVSGTSSQNKVGVVTAATSVSGPNNTGGMVWVAAIRLA